MVCYVRPTNYFLPIIQSLVMLAAVGEGYSRTPFLQLFQFFLRDSEGFPDLMLPTPSQPSLESPPN